MKIFDNNSLTIGETPLVRLNRIKGSKDNNILVKIEGRNPAYSVKCRVAAGILHRGIETGELKEGMTIMIKEIFKMDVDEYWEKIKSLG